MRWAGGRWRGEHGQWACRTALDDHFFHIDSSLRPDNGCHQSVLEQNTINRKPDAHRIIETKTETEQLSMNCVDASKCRAKTMVMNNVYVKSRLGGCWCWVTSAAVVSFHADCPGSSVSHNSARTQFSVFVARRRTNDAALTRQRIADCVKCLEHSNTYSMFFCCFFCIKWHETSLSE
ncbi:hypothetical protein CBL_07240 [Carabus blaptoides fortunei]